MQNRLQFINKTISYMMVCLCLVMLNYRSLVVDNSLGAYTSCEKCYQQSVLNADAGIIFSFVIILFAGVFFKNYLIRVGLRLFSIGLIAYYLLDVYIFKFLNQRLYFQDIAKYFDWTSISEAINRETNNHLLVSTFIAILLLFIYLFLHRAVRISKVDQLIFIAISLPLLFLTFQNNRIDYVNDVYLKNIVEINFKAKEAVKYSQETQQLAPNKILQIENLSCNSDGLNSKKNIVLLVVESLSNYQSLLHSGLNDWTPNLDKLALENSYYSNFFANNFTSLEGRIALLTGEKTFRGVTNFSERGYGRAGYWNTQRNLPKLLKSYGYHTAFLDGASLDFSNTGKYMNGIGFDYVEGSEYLGYKDKARFGFNSVADLDLYERVIDYIKLQEQTFFINVITVSTHAPYIDPETKTTSIELATKYADNAVAQFYKELQEINYFENGVLIITSDHRSMTPVSADELEKFGHQAVSRIPFIVIDNSQIHKAKVHHQYLQQSDLLNSIEYLVSEKHCSRKDEGNIFSNPTKPARCIYHSRGDYRERVDVYCDNGKQQATIELNGDNTKIINGELKNNSEVIDFINYSRLSADWRHQQYLQQRSK